ncbi:MAG TPA: hydrogenase maturation protease [Bryobacteraceae bacterium]|nr:hydrogenase maturation protease [Bryobacteraceae bacterium]
MNILVACIGNIFEGDDGFGCEVACELSRRRTAGAQVVDYGIRGIDLAYALMDGHDLTIFVDTISRGGSPGALYTIEPDLTGLDAGSCGFDAHRMNPLEVLRSVMAMGGRPGRLVLVGCEPGEVGGDEGRMGLTDAVAAAVPLAADIVESLVTAEREEIRV